MFYHTSIHELEPGSYYFDCAMITACKPVFDRCSDNYEVEDVLRKAKVILPQNQTDTESCALVLNFSSRKAGEAFIDRLNRYLEQKSVTKAEIDREWEAESQANLETPVTK